MVFLCTGVCFVGKGFFFDPVWLCFHLWPHGLGFDPSPGFNSTFPQGFKSTLPPDFKSNSFPSLSFLWWPILIFSFMFPSMPTPSFPYLPSPYLPDGQGFKSALCQVSNRPCPQTSNQIRFLHCLSCPYVFLRWPIFYFSLCFLPCPPLPFLTFPLRTFPTARVSNQPCARFQIDPAPRLQGKRQPGGDPMNSMT